MLLSQSDPTEDWPIADVQEVNISFVGTSLDHKAVVHIWQSCIGWVYPSRDDIYMQGPSKRVLAQDLSITLTIKANCIYTVTTLTSGGKQRWPSKNRPSMSFPLPYLENFDGPTVGGEAPFFGDQMGKFETVQASGGRSGKALRQQLDLSPWPILEPQCNGHSAPIRFDQHFHFVLS